MARSAAHALTAHDWIMLPVFAFLGLGLAVVALSYQGSGFVLLMGSLVCVVQVHDIWQSITRRRRSPAAAAVGRPG